MLVVIVENHSFLFYILLKRVLSTYCLLSQDFSECYIERRGFPGDSDGKASACNAGDPGSIPGLGRSPGEGNGNPLQYSYLENPMDGGACWATVYWVAKSGTQLSDFTFTFTLSEIRHP